MPNIASKAATFYGSKTWTINRRDTQKNRSDTNDIFMTAIWTLDHPRNS